MSPVGAERLLVQLHARPLAELQPELDALAEAIAACDDPERLAQIAAALPSQLSTLAPELGLQLARIGHQLIEHGIQTPEDLELLAPPVRVAWLRVGLAAVPPGPREHELLELVDDELLLRALAEPARWSLIHTQAPARILQRMIQSEQPRLRARVLDCLPSLVEHLALSPAEAFATLEQFAEDPSPRLRAAALSMLGATWLSPLPSPAAERRAHWVAAQVRASAKLPSDQGRPPSLSSTFELAAKLELRGPLVELALDEDAPPRVRALALSALGPLARERDIELALALATDEPLDYAAAARSLLLEAHRHGAFVRAPLLAALLDCFDAHGAWTGVELVRVTHVVRRELIAALRELDANDPRWIRRARILGASFGAGAHALTAELLARTDSLEVADALLEAAARAPEFDDEGALLAWLPRLPERVIPLLAFCKDTDTASEHLLALLTDPRCATHLRQPILRTLWTLSRERRALLEQLALELDATELAAFLRDAPPLGEDLPARLLAAHTRPETTQQQLHLLERLCASDDIELLEAVTRSYRRVTRAYVSAALAGDFSIKRERMPALEQLIYNYGQKLDQAARRIQPWLEGRHNGGRELILKLASDWLDEEPEPALAVAVLETLARHRPRGPSLRRIEVLWRHPREEVRRAAIEAIIGGEGDDESTRSARAREARGLELSLSRLVESEEPRLARQGLVAITRLRARWAEPLVIAALGRRQMGIKKEAASALEAMGSARCLPAVLGWLTRHDNPGLRERLLAALVRIAGPASAALLVAQLDTPQLEARERGLVHAALSRRLSLAALVHLVRAEAPGHAQLVEDALDGSLPLADASPQQLARALHRARLRPDGPAVNDEDPSEAMRRAGFSDSAARELLSLALDEDARLRPARAKLIELVRANFSSWRSWTAELEDGPHALALTLLLAAAGPAHRAQEADLLELLEATLEDGRPAASDPELLRETESWFSRSLVGRDAALRLRALALLRAFPHTPAQLRVVSGPRRDALLTKLGGLRTRADLDLCLSASRLGPRVAADSLQLLRTLALPPVLSPERARQRYGPERAEAIIKLHEDMRAWYRWPPEAARAWLDHVLGEYPLGLPLLPHPELEPRRPAQPPAQSERLAQLLEGLESEDPQVRERAATTLLEWPDARAHADSWAQVLSAYLEGRFELDRSKRGTLASELARSDFQPIRALDDQAEHSDASVDPAPEEARRRRARRLAPHFSRPTLRRLLPVWVERYAKLPQPDAESEAWLRALPQALLLPHARERAANEDYALLRVLHYDASSAMRELLAFMAERAPAEVTHLQPPTTQGPSQPSDDDLSDPLEGLERDELLALIHDRKVELGLGVRAIQALARLGEGSVEPLESLVSDRRPRIRSAALRALRGVSSRERNLAASARMLAIETREQVIAELLASLGHRRYEPALPQMLEYLTHRNTHLRNAAERALRGWGRSVLPKLRRAASKARPDRRRIYLEFAETLDGS